MARPTKFTPSELETKSQLYLEERKKEKKAPTLEGLALFMGVSKGTISEYRNRPAFAEAIKKVSLAGEVDLQNKAQDGKIGAFFMLKTIHGYSEKDKLEISGNLDSGVALPRRR